MRRILNILSVIILTPALLSCSGFSVKVDFEKDAELEELNKVGLVLRYSKSSTISLAEQLKNLNSWIGNHESIDNITFLTDCSDNLCYYTHNEDKIFQASIKYRKKGYFGLFWDDNFLPYKSLGTLNQFIKKNETELKGIMTDRSLSGLIIYEVYNIVSIGMQFIDFDSIVAIVDSNLNILYMDHQSDGYEINEMVKDRAKYQLMDKISERLIEKLEGLDIIGGIIKD